MAEVQAAPDEDFDLDVGTLIVGAGACGLVAALSAVEAGQEVLVIEADPVPRGSTALSAGLIPAAGTRLQLVAGIDDDPALFAADICRKSAGENDPALELALAEGAAPVIDWLCDVHKLPFQVVDDFDYPGHSRRRMHGLPSRSGLELIDALRSACERAGIDIICGRRVETLFQDGSRISGVEAVLPDGRRERIGCAKLVLACNGFGGNRDMVRAFMPEIENGVWFGHDGNRGEAIRWGEALGAGLKHLGAYQGHGNVAHPHGILITWAVISEGGIQVNREGHRFWNEAQGYSEAARQVLAQPGGIAYTIFDDRIAAIARQFQDFKDAEAQGAVLRADTVHKLAVKLQIPEASLAATLAALHPGARDGFGRTFGPFPPTAPYCAVKVTGALFHTQGGLLTNGFGQVLDEQGRVFANLYAGGGAACGVSGAGDSGYLSGNGLLSAVVFGRRAGGADLGPG